MDTCPMVWQEPFEEDIVPRSSVPARLSQLTGGAALLCKPTAVLSSYLNDISFASYASVTCPTLGYSKFPIVFPTQAHMKTARLWRARVQNH
jgi:hypothetical protein